MSENIKVKCPDCGNERKIWNNGTTVTCPYCGSHKLTDGEVEEAFWEGVDKNWKKEHNGISGMLTEKDADFIIRNDKDISELIKILKEK